MTNLPASELFPDSTTTLVVILHGWTVTPASMDHVKDVCRQSMPAAEILVPSLPLGFWSSVNPVKIARDVITSLDNALAGRQAKGLPPFDEIVLIGHSVGGLIARKVYLLAGPESHAARFEDSLPGSELAQASPWFGKVRRVILLAGMNRGWTISHHLSLRRAVLMYAGLLLAEAVRLVTDHELVILHARRGARFITEYDCSGLLLPNGEKHSSRPSRSNCSVPSTILLLQPTTSTL